MITLFGIGTLVIEGSRPSMPSDWRKLRPGMSRDEVLANLQVEVTDLREAKGFDLASHKTGMLGSPVFWQLQIIYDQSGKLKEAEAHFTHKKCGIFNTKPKNLL